jgi:hypothetical protein
MIASASHAKSPGSTPALGISDRPIDLLIPYGFELCLYTVASVAAAQVMVAVGCSGSLTISTHTHSHRLGGMAQG